MKTSLILVTVLLILVTLGGWLYSHKSPASQLLPTPTPAISIIPSAVLSLSPSPVLQLPTTYISAVDWPPKVRVENTPFSCTEAGSETARAGQTKKVVINNHTYCVTQVTEGAAGSIYTQYAYAREKNNQTEIITFSLRFVQCGNYSEPEKTACEKERQTFNIDNFIDEYAK